MVTTGVLLTIEDNLWTRVDGGEAVVREALSYRPPGYVFTWAYKSGAWDGWTCLLRPDSTFPAGLTEHVAEHLKAAGYGAEVVDKRSLPMLERERLFSPEPLIELEPHQLEAVEAAERAGRGVIHYPVAAGKTIICLELVRRLNVPALALVHRKDLLYQMAGRAQELFGMKTGVVGDGQWTEGPFTVATFQTIFSRLSNKYTRKETVEWLKQWQAVHVDEVHHVAAETYERVMKYLPNAYYRYGYSATPTKSGDIGTFLRVSAWTGPVIAYMPSSGGIKAGRLVPADLFIVEPGAPSPVDLDYATAYDTGIVRHKRRNETIVEIANALRPAGPVLILVERIEHGEKLAEALGCPFLSGSTSGYARQQKWDAIRAGLLDCAVASVIADEGLDIPNIRTLILAGGGKATHRQIQRIGRGMRKSEGKQHLTAFDFADRGRYLGRQYKTRRRSYNREAAYTTVDLGREELEAWLRSKPSST